MHGKTEKPINQWPLATPSEEKKKKCKKRRNRERERRKTSPCNLLPQHSVSDVVWLLVHKANQIHTLPSYISGNGVSGGRVMGNESKRQKLGAGDRGGGVDVCVRGGEEEREEQVFCVYSHRVAARNFRPHKRFTFVIFADPVPCKRLMSEMMNQNKPISQSLTQTDSQGGRRAARQTLFSEQNQTQILSGQISLSPFSLLFPFFLFFPQWSFSSSLLPSFVSVMAALDCCFDRSIQRLAEKKLGGQTDNPRTV